MGRGDREVAGRWLGDGWLLAREYVFLTSVNREDGGIRRKGGAYAEENVRG